MSERTRGLRRAIIARTAAWTAAHPLAAPVFAGAVLRAITAWVALGFHARDDYFHVLEPALRFLEDPSFDWDASDVAGAGIRSHLLPRLVHLALVVTRAAGVHDPDTTLRILYLCAGAYSLTVVPAMWLTAGRLLDERGQRIATWLAAAHFVMPYAGTRLLLDSLAMPPVTLALGLAAGRRGREQVLAGLCLGLACWLRYPVATLAIGVAVAAAIAGWRATGPRGAVKAAAALGAGGALGLVAQGVFDVFAGGTFLGPLSNNLAINTCAASPSIFEAACAWARDRGLEPDLGLSRSTPWAYAGMWLLLTAPPATVVLLPAMVHAARRLPSLVWPFVTFVGVHSLIPHKEERFMLPALPIFLLLCAAAPAALGAAHRNGGWRHLRRWWPTARAWFLVVHAAALILAITNDSQGSQRDAMLALRRDAGLRALVSVGPEVQPFVLARPEAPYQRISTPDPAAFEAAYVELANILFPPNRFLAFEPDREAVTTLLMRRGLDCEPPEVLDGWWLDRLVFRLNPEHNRRRAPVVLWRCEAPSFAGTRSQAVPAHAILPRDSLRRLARDLAGDVELGSVTGP